MGLRDEVVEVIGRKSFIVEGFNMMADVMRRQACGGKTGR